MNQLLPLLPELEAALLLPRAAGMPVVNDAAAVKGLIRGIQRKAAFVQMHLRLLGGIDWARVDGIGRVPPGGGAVFRLAIPLEDASIEFQHPGALTDYVYLAFDGLVAAVINMTDTFGRLINMGFSLGIDERKASVLSVRDRCSPTSPLGTVLHDGARMGWLKVVRELRGRCQHADVDDAVTTTGGRYATRGQPIIHRDHCWQVPPVDTEIVRYGQDAAAATERCLSDASRAVIATCPANPLV